MVIKSARIYTFLAICKMLLCPLLAVLCAIDGMAKELFWFFLLISFPVGWLFFRECVLVTRTLSMDRDGCTVTFGKKSVHFLWKDLAIRRVETNRSYNQRGRYTAGPSYRSGAFFSVDNIDKPIGDSTSYCLFGHLWDTFFVNFPNEDACRIPGEIEGIAEVNKEDFLAKMEEWGVELEFV